MVPIRARTLSSAPNCGVTRTSAAAKVVDPAFLDVAARRLGFDPADPRRLVDLAAVAVTRLAWRDSPVEDWHAVPLRRISDGEMMRTNAATTRLPRDLLRNRLPSPLSSRANTCCDPAALFAAVHDTLVDPSRQLPDGRMLAALPPEPAQLALLDDHVRTLCDVWTSHAVHLGLRTMLTLLSCYAARFCRRWWLTPSWPHIVAEYIRRIGNPACCRDQPAGLWRRPTDGTDNEQLRRLLLAGPDMLGAEAAADALRTGLGALLPHDCGLPAIPRHVLPVEYLRLLTGPQPIPPSTRRDALGAPAASKAVGWRGSAIPLGTGKRATAPGWAPVGCRFATGAQAGAAVNLPVGPWVGVNSPHPEVGPAPTHDQTSRFQQRRTGSFGDGLTSPIDHRGERRHDSRRTGDPASDHADRRPGDAPDPGRGNARR
jgi:hypothetical protein